MLFDWKKENFVLTWCEEMNGLQRQRVKDSREMKAKSHVIG